MCTSRRRIAVGHFCRINVMIGNGSTGTGTSAYDALDGRYAVSEYDEC
jgi:hypothetical protein